MKHKPKIYHLNDIWRRYVIQLLAANPDWSTGYNSDATFGTRKDYYVYRPYDKFDTKLNNKRVEVLNFGTFVLIIDTFFTRAKDAIIGGEVLNLGNRLGKIHMERVQRSFKNKKIDFAKTKKYPMIEDPITGVKRREQIVYFTDDDWCRIAWKKTHGITNETIYQFKPTQALKSRKGFTQMVADALANDKLLKYKYLYRPLIKSKPVAQ